MVQSHRPLPSSLPLFNSRKGHVSTGDLLFRILSQNYPLTLSKLHQELLKQYRLKLSYQAVRKAMMTLSSLGAVEHGKGGFQLSVHWLLAARNEIDSVIKSYTYGKGAGTANKKAVQTFSGSCLYEMDLIWGEIVVNLCAQLESNKKNGFISINHFPWWIPMNVGHEVEFCNRLRTIGVQPVYLFTERCKSTLWAKDFYGSIGVGVTIKKCRSIPETHYYNIIGEYLIEVVLPLDLARMVRTLFGRTRVPSEMSPKDLTSLAHKKAEIQLTVQANQTLSRSMLNAVFETVR